MLRRLSSELAQVFLTKRLALMSDETGNKLPLIDRKI